MWARAAAGLIGGLAVAILLGGLTALMIDAPANEALPIGGMVAVVAWCVLIVVAFSIRPARAGIGGTRRDATKALYDVHSWAGFVVGIALLVVCLSGAVAVFSPEIDLWANPSLKVEQTGPVSIDAGVALERLSAAAGTDPTKAEYFYLPGNIHGLYGLPAPTDSAPDRILYLNAYTSELTAPRSNHVNNFLRHLHVRLLIDYSGRIVVGLIGIAMVVSVITGVLIYKRILRDFFTMRWRKSKGARLTLADLHRLIGVWALLFHFVIGATGAWLGLESYATSWVASVAGLPEADEKAKPNVAAPAPPPNVAALIAQTEAAIPGIVPTVIAFDGGTDAAGKTRISGNLPGLVQQGSAFVAFDAAGNPTEIYDVREKSGWTRFRYALEPLHYGYYGGLWLKICYLVLGLLPALLSITGALIWFERRKREDREQVRQARKAVLAERGI